MSFRVLDHSLYVAGAGPHKFFPISDTEQLIGFGHGNSHALLAAHSGFVRSTRSSDQSLLNVHYATAAFYPPGALQELIDHFIGDSQDLEWPR